MHFVTYANATTRSRITFIYSFNKKKDKIPVYCNGLCADRPRVTDSRVQHLNHWAIKVPERPNRLCLAGSLYYHKRNIPAILFRPLDKSMKTSLKVLFKSLEQLLYNKALMVIRKNNLGIMAPFCWQSQIWWRHCEFCSTPFFNQCLSNHCCLQVSQGEYPPKKIYIKPLLCKQLWLKTTGIQNTDIGALKCFFNFIFR